MAQRLAAEDPWALATWEGSRVAQEQAWQKLSPGESRAALHQMKANTVAIWRSHGHDISHILAAPDPATAEARVLGCVCPEQRTGELHMLPDCPVHHYPLGFLSPKAR